MNLQLAVLGVASGAAYALLAVGVVVVHRASGVINFAQGAIGMASSFLFWELNQNHQWAFGAAAAAACLFAAAIGALIQLTMRLLKGKSALARTLVTLGVLMILGAIAQQKYSTNVYVVPSELPTNTLRFLGVTLGEDQAIIFGLATALAATLSVVYRRTAFGRATTAIAENPVAGATLGLSANSVAMANWMIGAVLAAVAGILLTPIIGLEESQLTLLVVPALAAAVVGGLSSFWLTFAAAVGIGVVQSELSAYGSSYGAALPFVVVIAILMFRGSRFPVRGFVAAGLPRVGAGQIQWRYLGAGIIAILFLIALLPTDWVAALSVTLITAIILLSVVVVTGYCGQLSLAQYTMAGLGGFVAGRIAQTQHVSFLPALAIGVLAAVPAGVIVGAPALRARGAQLAVATLCMAAAIQALIFDSFTLTGGANGTVVSSPHIFGADVGDLDHPRAFSIMSLVFLVIAGLATANLRRGRAGRQMLGVRANERAAASLGVPVARTKLSAFALGSVFAAVGGILLAFSNSFVAYSTYSPIASVTVVTQSVIGGVGYPLGAVLGAQLQPGGIVTRLGDAVFGTTIQNYIILFSGVLLIQMLITLPDGMAFQMGRDARRLVRFLGRTAQRGVGRFAGARSGAGPTDASAEHPAPATESMPAFAAIEVKAIVLEARDLQVTLGGTRAVDGVSLRIDPGKIVGLIGPNGAGKTTLIDALTGFVSPQQGSIVLGGEELTKMSAHARAHCGLARTFQSLELFEDLTIRENLVISSEAHGRRLSILRDLVRPHRPQISAPCQDVISRFGIEAYLDRRPPNVPYGIRHLAAIARSVAAAPSILLLDEPTAGLDGDSTGEVMRLIRLAADAGMGVLLVEHKIDVVMDTCDEIFVLNFGRIIAAGAPESIRRDQAVIDAYLGKEINEPAPAPASPVTL